MMINKIKKLFFFSPKPYKKIGFRFNDIFIQLKTFSSIELRWKRIRNPKLISKYLYKPVAVPIDSKLTKKKKKTTIGHVHQIRTKQIVYTSHDRFNVRLLLALRITFAILRVRKNYKPSVLTTFSFVRTHLPTCLKKYNFISMYYVCIRYFIRANDLPVVDYNGLDNLKKF